MTQLGSLPRPALIAIVGGVAALALLFTMRRGGEETTPPAPAPTQSTGQDATGAATGTQSGTQAQQGQRGGASSQTSSASERALPQRVERALDAKKVVAVLFYNPKSVDDLSVKRSVESISSRGGKVATFTDEFENVARYVRLTAPAAVTQTPTIVVVDRRGNGRFATGFRDTASVDQLVVDALK